MVNQIKINEKQILNIFKNDNKKKNKINKKGGIFTDIINQKLNNKSSLNKKIMTGGNLAHKVVKTIEDTIQWIVNTFNWVFGPIFWFYDYLASWFFKPDGAMPCTWAHVYFLAFIIAILLFIVENGAIILCRAVTDNILNYLNFPAFNLNYWINFVQFNFVLLFLTFSYKFINGNVDIFYLYLLTAVLILLFQKGLIIQTVYFITGVWIKL